jgi:hypothetical protein
MQLLRAAIITGFWLCVWQASAWACSCHRVLGTVTEFNKEQAVFLGKVKTILPDEREIEVTPIGGKNAGNPEKKKVHGYSVTFEVKDSFKGASEIKNLHTDEGGGLCGYYFEVGKEYLVYAYEFKGMLNTSICTRTRSASGAEDDLAILRALKKGEVQPRIFGFVYRMDKVVDGVFGFNSNNRVMPQIKVIAKSKTNKYETLTNEEGDFRFVDLPFGEYEVSVELPKAFKLWANFGTYNEQRKIVLNSSEWAGDLSFVARLDAPISGTVFNEFGKPVNTQVQVTVAAVYDSSISITKDKSADEYTNESGYFSFDGLPPGRYVVGINILSAPYSDSPFPATFYPKTSDLSQATIIEFKEGEQKKIAIHLFPRLKPRTIGGVVFINGRPAKEANVYLVDPRNLDDLIFGLEAETDRAGRFTIQCFQGQEYLIYAQRYERDWESESDKLPVPVGTLSKTIKLSLRRKKEAAPPQQPISK